MKKKLVSLLFLLTGISLPFSLWAVPSGSPLAAGDYYLYNVGAQKYVDLGSGYGSRATLYEHQALLFTLTGSGTTYKLISNATEAGNGLFIDGSNYPFLDDKAVDFTFNKTATNVYTIERSSRYLKWDGTNDRLYTGTEVTGDNEKWMLISREDALDDLRTQMQTASEENPVNASLFIQFARPTCLNTKFNNYWTSTGTAGKYNSSSGGLVVTEIASNTGSIYQQLSGLPNGEYVVSCTGFTRAGFADYGWAHRNDCQAVLYATGSTTVSTNMPSIYDNSRTETSKLRDDDATNDEKITPNTLVGAAYWIYKGHYDSCRPSVRVTVTDGSLRIGVNNPDGDPWEWTVCTDFRLIYVGANLTALVDNYNGLLSEAKSLQDEPMHVDVKTALNSAITAAETDANTNSQQWLENIISLLGTAVSNAQASNALYTGAILAAVNGMKAQSASDDVKAAVQQKYDDREYATTADVYAYYQPLEIAALGTADNTDYTSAIINPSFELGNTDGWDFDTKGSDTGAHHTNNATYSYSNTEGDYLFNTWSSSIQTLDIKQTITGLPLGHYSISAVVASFGDGASIIMTAGSALNSVAPSDPSNIDGHKAVGYTLNIDDVFVTDGSLTIQVKNTGKGQTLLKCDAFKLTLKELYTPLDNYSDLSFEVNLENSAAAGFLATTPYTEATASVIGNYATDVALRFDQPAVVTIPIPAQDEDATLYVSLNSDYSSALTYTVASGSIIYDIVNLIPQSTYYYKVEANSSVVTNGTITTTGRLRMIKADGIANMRDMGGWLNADGNRIKYGKLYRGSELRAGKFYTASDADLAMMKDELGIGAEVDLRENVDFQSGTMNASAIDGATYYYANLSRWSEDALNFDADKFQSAFDLILTALKADKVAYFHCIYGADRTGCFAFLLEGLLGLPVDQLYKDYELTSFSSAGSRTKDGIDHKLQYIKNLPGDNLQQKFYNYWRGAVGVNESDLNDFINIMIDGTNSITSAELADLPTKAVEDGTYYIYLPNTAVPGTGAPETSFLGRGRNFGSQGVPDRYGIPAAVSTNGVGVTTIKFLDNNLYFGSDGFTDKTAYYNSVSWNIEQRGDDLVMKSHNGSYLYMNEGTRAYVDDADVTHAVPVLFKTVAQQKAIVEAAQQANILAAASAAGITAADIRAFESALTDNYTPVASTATILSATSGSTTNWPLSAPNARTDIKDKAYNVGSYGGELYHYNGSISQTVNVSHAGLYKLTLNAFYRQGSNSNCYTVGEAGVDNLSNAYVSINDTYVAQIPSWYSDCASSANPNTTGEAKTLMDDGKYAIELYAYIGNEKQATITINVPGYVAAGWCLFNNFALTEYAKKVSLTEDAVSAPEACDFADVTAERTIPANKWATLCLPFAISKPDGWEVRELSSVDTNDGIYTLNFTEAEALEAGKPYMVKTEEAVSSINATGVAVVTEPVEVTDNDVTMVGTFTSGYIPADAYFISNNTFYQAADDTNTIKAFRAYFNVTATSEARGLVMSFADTTTCIGILPVDETVLQVFDISGQPQRSLKHGVNLIQRKDGKVMKVFVK